MKLRYYQTEAIESLYQYFMVKQGNPIVCLPTGTGKSAVIAGFAERALKQYPTTRIMVLTHVKEIIEANANQMRRIWPQAPIGINSAGLGVRDIGAPILFGGVKSVVKNITAFGHVDILIIDECHLLSPSAGTMYQLVIDGLRKCNPFLKVIGLSATAFRLGQGMLTENGVFTDVCYDMTDLEGWKRLIAEGYLSIPIPKRTQTALDVSNVGMNNGEFAKGALQEAVDKKDVTFAALTEMCDLGRDRESWLIFCSGIDHAEHVSTMLNSFGISCAAIHSKITKEERDERITAFKAGKLRAISNNNVLTTGFDHPPIDLIGMLRPTMSPGLHVQMLGRGTRPSPETNKRNCLILDFARNVQRLGPINDPMIPRAKGEKSGDVPAKICPKCGTYCHTKVRFCEWCNYEFVFDLNIARTASTEEIIKSDMPVVEHFKVISAIYNLHRKAGKPDSIKVSYSCDGMRQFQEWVCLEHPGLAKHRAHEWWRQRFTTPPPLTTREALLYINGARVPKQIRVWVNKMPAEILSYEY